ncbi:hypothetical protein CW304_28775 [Bacillus sp. UFRGS-B20]|nr:hypothetical protein CW304_28775 [Bacillus sp. UFRGS-B20]
MKYYEMKRAGSCTYSAIEGARPERVALPEYPFSYVSPDSKYHDGDIDDLSGCAVIMFGIGLPAGYSGLSLMVEQENEKLAVFSKLMNMDEGD